MQYFLKDDKNVLGLAFVRSIIIGDSNKVKIFLTREGLGSAQTSFFGRF